MRHIGIGEEHRTPQKRSIYRQGGKVLRRMLSQYARILEKYFTWNGLTIHMCAGSQRHRSMLRSTSSRPFATRFGTDSEQPRICLEGKQELTMVLRDSRGTVWQCVEVMLATGQPGLLLIVFNVE